MRDVNSKNLARLERNDMNNKFALVKHVQYIHKVVIWIGITQKFWQKEQIIQEENFQSPFLFTQIIMLLMTKPIVFIQLLIIIKNLNPLDVVLD